MQKADLFIGMNFITPNGGKLSVIGSVGKKQTYYFNCSICSADKELFPDGIFTARKEHIYRGVIPCGCSKSPRMNENQAIVMMKRSSSCEKYKYVGMVGQYTGVGTRVIMSCGEHGDWSTSRVDRVIRGVICPKCKPSVIGNKLKETNLLPDEVMIDRFMDGGGYQDRSIFKRSSRSGYWYIYCHACANDDISKAGLCDGWFESQAGHITRGRKACRCSNNFKWSQEQREFTISSECKSRGLDFMGWDDGSYRTTQSKFIASCLYHGRFATSVANFMYQGTSCPGCAHGGYDQTSTGYVYTLRSDCGAYIKVGISNAPERRHKELARFTPFKFTDTSIYEMDGRKARIIERDTHNRFISAGLAGFPGCTEWLRYDPEIIEYIEQRAN